MSLLERLSNISFDNGNIQMNGCRDSREEHCDFQTLHTNPTAIPAISATHHTDDADSSKNSGNSSSNTDKPVTGQDPFAISGQCIKVYLPPIKAEVWFCSDDRARSSVIQEGIVCLLFEDLDYIRKGTPGEERLSRLLQIYARRLPITSELIELFKGRITAINLKSKLLSQDNHLQITDINASYKIRS